MNEDAFPIEHGDFPASHVIVYWRVTRISWTGAVFSGLSLIRCLVPRHPSHPPVIPCEQLFFGTPKSLLHLRRCVWGWLVIPPQFRCDWRDLGSCSLESMGFSGTPKDMGPPYGKLPILFPYHPHFRIPKDMGIVWVPLTIFGGPMSLGVPGITLEWNVT